MDVAISNAYIESATVWNVALAEVPMELMAVRHTITIRANITAYSTAVGPSSETRKRCTFLASDFISVPPLQRQSSDGQINSWLTAGLQPESNFAGSLEHCDGHKTAACLQHALRIPGTEKQPPHRHSPKRGFHPFGSPASGKTRPLALRPGLATGLPLSRMRETTGLLRRWIFRVDKFYESTSGRKGPLRRGSFTAATEGGRRYVRPP